MKKQLVLSTWLASLLILFSGLSGAGEVVEDSWDQTALTKPEAVSAWLQKNTKAADRKKAHLILEHAIETEKQGRVSASIKLYGESALRFPTPMALVGYADNTLRDLSSVRTRQKDTSKIKGDLASALALYRSALAADEQLKLLSAPSLAQLKTDEACLDTYLKATSPSLPQSTTCRPLTLYAVRP